MLNLFVSTIVASCRRMSRCNGSLGHVTWISMKLSAAAFLAAIGAPALGLGWLAYMVWVIFTLIAGASALLFLLCAVFAVDDGVRAVHAAVRSGEAFSKRKVGA
jgi:hypothetical protein